MNYLSITFPETLLNRVEKGCDVGDLSFGGKIISPVPLDYYKISAVCYQ
jgi:hypothetical protein